MPWTKWEGRYYLGFESFVSMDRVQVPCALASLSTGIIFVLVWFAERIHPLRAYFVSVFLCGATIGLYASCLEGVFPLNGHSTDSRQSQVTVVPIILMGLLSLLTLDCFVRLLCELILPIIGWYGMIRSGVNDDQNPGRK